jgi:Zinc carboxypeptidase
MSGNRSTAAYPRAPRLRRQVGSFLIAAVIPVLCVGNMYAQWFNDYKTYGQINSKLDEFAISRPDLVTPINIGNSVQGRAIRGVKIQGAGGNRNHRPTVLINGVQHAREWIAAMTPMYIADQLISGYNSNPGIRSLMDQVDVVVLPVINPDGYEYSWTTNRNWRKNRANNGDGTFGVDLNRNWGQGWGLNSGSSPSTSSEVYRGPSAFSEPETRALRDYFHANQNIVSTIDFHAYSQLILYPWAFTPTPVMTDGPLFERLGNEMAQSIFDVHGETYLVGQVGIELYLASGASLDWTYGNQGAYSYTIELRPDSPNPGFVLPASEIIPVGQENLPAFLDMMEFTAQMARGDFNYDQQFNCSDVNKLVNVIVNGTNRAEYDLNRDGVVSSPDLASWLANAGANNLGIGRSYLPGDANLDGSVDGSDFNIWNNSKFTTNASFCSGDFNANGVIDGGDFGLWNAYKFTSSDGTQVPEPAAGSLLTCCLIGYCGVRMMRARGSVMSSIA